MWLTAGKTNALETRDEHATTTGIVVMHAPHVFFSMTQRLQCCLLCGSTCAHDGILVNLDHRFQDVRWSSNVANAPARHGIGLREAIEQDGPLLHTWDTGNADMFRVIDEATIYFVNSNDQVMLYGESSNSLQLVARDDRSGGIVWVAEEDHLCAWSNNMGNLSCPYGKVIFRIRWDGNGDTTRKNNICFVGHISWVWRNHFIAWIDNRPHCQIYAFAHTNGHQQLRPGIIAESVAALQHGRDLLTEFEQAKVRGVLCMPLLNRAYTGLTDMLRFYYNGTTTTERDHVWHCVNNIEELPNS